MVILNIPLFVFQIRIVSSCDPLAKSPFLSTARHNISLEWPFRSFNSSNYNFQRMKFKKFYKKYNIVQIFCNQIPGSAKTLQFSRTHFVVNDVGNNRDSFVMIIKDFYSK
ncbi:hypothetical protein BpHYR1_010063 [Brachionus plicatilis]|uniref:Uncharacterized protein n=1 Tax=Brachionus plicatilis TaxID=10195 RepID=A0A3M7RDQ2_BRAPC|nr:hypothetical protein BpHYR1_010063 [Brachionus plicatilis]